MGGGDIVLSSDWKEMESTQEDYVYLVSKLEKYGLTLSAHTEDQMYKRGAGIQFIWKIILKLKNM